jgi:N-acetylglucosamine-6-phosphate deacetylase
VCTIAASHRRFGTTAMLPTVITDAPHVLAAALDAVRSARAAGEASVLGIHVEGPFLDPQRKGAHEAQFIRTMQEADVEQLASSNCGELMLTLAPNKVPPNLIRQLVARGVRVSLGHSEASFAEAEAAIDAGATAFTHLFNAMSQWEGRQPGMVGAALSDPRTFVGIIADGFHAHDVSLRLALTAASPDRFMLVSDAMPPAAGGPDTFELQGRRVTRVNGRLQLADGTLAGSNLRMDEAVRHCVNRLGLPLATALQMASRNPARFLGRSHDLGIVSVGALASLVHLDQELNVQRTWVEGT